MCRAAGARTMRFCSPARARRSRSPAPRRRPAGERSAGRRRSTSRAPLRRARRHASLVHDAAEGGLAVALAEAALWSGVGAELDLDDEPLTLFGEIGGQVIVAVPAGQVEPDPTGGEIDVRRIGTVGGDALFGIPLEELAHAHEGTA